MKLLHTADLHLGRMLRDVSLLDDQRKILDELSGIAVKEGVNAVLIAGDVYQKVAPQAEAMELFDGFISTMMKTGIRVFVVSGNHDSAQRISYFSALAKLGGVYVTERFTGKLQTVEMEDEFGKVYFHLLPFVRPIDVRQALPQIRVSDYSDAVRNVINASEIDFSARNILIAHQFVTGSQLSGSEDKTIGTVDNVDLELFTSFDYVALGHIHRAQCLKKNSIRYSGSPLKYSVDEAEHHKSCVIVDLGPKGTVDTKTIEITQPHEVRKVEGYLDEIMLQPYSEDYIWVTVHDDEVPPDSAARVSTVFPNLMGFTVENAKSKQDRDVRGAAEVENLDPVKLFTEFYAKQNNGEGPSDKQIELFKKLFREVKEQ